MRRFISVDSLTDTNHMPKTVAMEESAKLCGKSRPTGRLAEQFLPCFSQTFAPDFMLMAFGQLGS
jgi:hypothetical protein